MQTQLNQNFREAKKFSKQEYNRLYYQRKTKQTGNKLQTTNAISSEVLAEANSADLKINETYFNFSQLLQKALRVIELVALIALTTILTYFQLHCLNSAE